MTNVFDLKTNDENTLQQESANQYHQLFMVNISVKGVLSDHGILKIQTRSMNKSEPQ